MLFKCKGSGSMATLVLMINDQICFHLCFGLSVATRLAKC